MNRIVALGISLFFAIVGIALLDGDRTAEAGHSGCCGCSGCSGCSGCDGCSGCHGCGGWRLLGRRRCRGCCGCVGSTNCCNGACSGELEIEDAYVPGTEGNEPEPAPEGDAPAAEGDADAGAEAASDQTIISFQSIKEAVFDENGKLKYVYKKSENDKSQIANKRFDRSPVTYHPAQFR